MRSRYIFRNGEIVCAIENGVTKFDHRDKSNDPGYVVIPDCAPFQSMIDGSMIHSKSQYREHLKAHGCIEIGNDSSVMNPVRKPLQSPPGLKEQIARVVYEKLRY